MADIITINKNDWTALKQNAGEFHSCSDYVITGWSGGSGDLVFEKLRSAGDYFFMEIETSGLSTIQFQRLGVVGEWAFCNFNESPMHHLTKIIFNHLTEWGQGFFYAGKPLSIEFQQPQTQAAVVPNCFSYSGGIDLIIHPDSAGVDLVSKTWYGRS